MIDNAPVMVEELDRRKADREVDPSQETEMAFWEAAARLGEWFLVNRGTEADPFPMVLDPGTPGLLLSVYSCRARAEEAAAGAPLLHLPVWAALDYLPTYGARGVAGIVMDNPGPWIPLANLAFLKRWLPEGGHAALSADTIISAPRTQQLLDAFAAEPSDEAYEAVLRQLADEKVLVVLDPDGSGAPAHIVNDREERITLAFTDSERLTAFYAGKSVEVQERPAAEFLALVRSNYDVVIVDMQHPSAFVANREWILDVLGGR